ncbi:MAG: alpha/beta fold hydrolase [Steroidobacteraceae bacterium]
MSAEDLAGAGDRWVGAAALAGGKHYAYCNFGALHYRRLCSTENSGALPAVLLLHQTPFGLVEWVDVQPRLARLGFDVIAPDNPGFGMSDPPPATVTIADLADNLATFLDTLGLADVAVAGHHTGAAIAAAFASRHANRVSALVLHGCPLYSLQERSERLARAQPSLAPTADGSHLSDLFRSINGYAGDATANMVSTTWATLGAALAGSSPSVYRAVFANDMTGDIDAIRAPTLVLTDEADNLHDKDLQVQARRQDFELSIFSTRGSFALMQDPHAWAAKVAEFLRRAQPRSLPDSRSC